MDLMHACFENDLTANTNDEFKYDSDAELANKITELAGHINAVTYRFLKALAEFDRRKGWNKNGISSCSHWLNWQCSISATTAREKLRVAHCLDKLPKTNAAFESGVLSYSKVRAMTRVATDENEEILLDVAIGGTASHMERLVRRYQQVDENQQPIDQGDEYQQRKFDYFQDKGGMWVLRGRLPQVEGGLFIKAIEEVVRQQFKNASAEASKIEGEGEDAVEGLEKATFTQKRADALAALAEHFVATATVDDENGGITALAGHERCQVVLHVQAETLKAEHHQHLQQEQRHGDGCDCDYDAPLLPSTNIGHQWINPDNAKKFCCDASILTAVEDEYGNVLNLGRKTRTVSPALKRALDIRDETCRYPGCCANKYVEFHHVKHWGNFGPTNPDNLVKLCRFHHDQLHQGHYTIHLQQQTKQNHGQKWLFKTATGDVIDPNPVLPMSKTNDYFEEEWPNIDSQTAVSRWRGKPLDYPRAINDLLRCKYPRKAHYRNKKA